MKNRLWGSLILVCALCLTHARAGEPQISDWAREEVAAAYKSGLVEPAFGLGADLRAPVTREQFARLIIGLAARAGSTTAAGLAAQYGLLPEEASAPQEQDAADEGAPEADEATPHTVAALPERIENSPFSDTDSPYAALAACLGVAQGENGLFRPQEPIERCEAAAMLTRCMAALGYPEANAQPGVFEDAWAMPRWSVEAVKYVSGRRTPEGRAVMGGADGRFEPHGALTVEEAILAVGRCDVSRTDAPAYEGWRDAPGYDTVQLVFTAGGDCTFGRGAGFSYSGSFDEAYDKYGPSYFFQNAAAFHEDDLTMVNFEGTLTDASRAADKEFVFKGRAEYAKILEAGSIDVVSVANNHSKDYLQRGFEDTVRNLAPYVAVSGYERMPVLTVKGVRVGFASNVGWTFDAAQKRFIENAVQSLREQGAELIIFNYHWGVEGDRRSNETQRAIAHYCIDSGADLVIGHHPHVVQEVETYKGRQIAYSLGNLSFGGNRNPRDKNCLLFQQTFLLDLDTRARVDSTYRAIPYRISSVSERNDYRPTPV